MTKTSRPALRRWGTVGWALMAILAVGFAVYASGSLAVGGSAKSNIPINPDVASHFLSLLVHALPGGLALLLGPFQFVTVLRVRYPLVHRTMGRIYLIAVVVAAVASLFAATFSRSGFSVQVAFYLLAAAWLYTAAQAYRTIRRGEVQLHKIWMIRNYSLTFAAVSLRVFLLAGVSQLSVYPSLTFDDVYHASAWASIVVNVFVAEYFIVQRMLAPPARRRLR